MTACWACRVTGTKLINVTLWNAEAVVDWMVLCLEITPPASAFEAVTRPELLELDAGADTEAAVWGRPYIPLFATAGDHGRDDGVGVADVRPVNVVVLGDTGKFDGMKRFLYTNMVHAPRTLVNFTYVDLSCRTAMGVMGQMLVEGNVRIVSKCVSCSLEVCPTVEAFYEFTQQLPRFESIDAVPSPWRGVLDEVAALLASADAVLLVSALPALSDAERGFSWVHVDASWRTSAPCSAFIILLLLLCR